MSDTNTSNEVGKMNNTDFQVAFFPLDINIKNLGENAQGNPNGTSGVIVVDERLAQLTSPKDLLVGNVAITVAPVTPEIEAIVNKRAKASGGVEKGEGGVVTLKQRENARKMGGREQG